MENIDLDIFLLPPWHASRYQACINYAKKNVSDKTGGEIYALASQYAEDEGSDTITRVNTIGNKGKWQKKDVNGTAMYALEGKVFQVELTEADKTAKSEGTETDQTTAEAAAETDSAQDSACHPTSCCLLGPVRFRFQIFHILSLRTYCCSASWRSTSVYLHTLANTTGTALFGWLLARVLCCIVGVCTGLQTNGVCMLCTGLYRTTGAAAMVPTRVYACPGE